MILALGFSMSGFASLEGEVEAQSELKARIAESEFVVDICVYEMEWVPPTPSYPKAKWVQRAVVTSVHKGVIEIGTKLEFFYNIEEPPKLFKTQFRTVVEGELYTFFFSSDDGVLLDGKYTLDAPGQFRFGRGEGDFAAGRGAGNFAAAFRKELKSNPELKPKNEQAAPSGGNKPAK